MDSPRRATHNNMKIPLSIRGLKDIFWDPRSFFKELKRSSKMGPAILVPYLVLLVIIVVWYYSVADVIARNITYSGSLSSLYQILIKKILSQTENTMI